MATITGTAGATLTAEFVSSPSAISWTRAPPIRRVVVDPMLRSSNNGIEHMEKTGHSSLDLFRHRQQPREIHGISPL